MEEKERLDMWLTRMALSPTRSKAREWIVSGLVLVNGTAEKKPGTFVGGKDQVEIIKEENAFVSRGGKKLQKAMDTFAIDVKDLVCLDLGASTGGFTDCLLKHGAAKVYAVDAGHDQLAEVLRSDRRVISLEGVNGREISQKLIPERIGFSCVDVSFISLKLVLPALLSVLEKEAVLVTLVKPQFEAGRGFVDKNGVVKDSKIHVKVLEEITAWGKEAGLYPFGLTFSPIKGPKGNIEFLVAWKRTPSAFLLDIKGVVNEAHRNSFE